MSELNLSAKFKEICCVACMDFARHIHKDVSDVQLVLSLRDKKLVCSMYAHYKKVEDWELSKVLKIRSLDPLGMFGIEKKVRAMLTDTMKEFAIKIGTDETSVYVMITPITTYHFADVNIWLYKGGKLERQLKIEEFLK